MKKYSIGFIVIEIAVLLVISMLKLFLLYLKISISATTAILPCIHQLGLFYLMGIFKGPGSPRSMDHIFNYNCGNVYRIRSYR